MSNKNIIGCKLCGQVVEASKGVEVVTCNTCIQEASEWPAEVRINRSQGYPRGWKFMKQFVHQDGTVYYRGTPQPSLKGKLPPTEIKLKQKKTKAEKERERMQLFSEIGLLKSQLKKETRKTAQTKLVRQISKLQRQIK